MRRLDFARLKQLATLGQRVGCHCNIDFFEIRDYASKLDWRYTRSGSVDFV